MVELGYNAEQTLQPGAGAILETIRPCTHRPQNVLHEDMSPVFNLRGIVNNPCCGYAEYLVKFSCNIALAEGATVGEIQAAFAQDGQIVPLTIAAVTPAAVGNYWHVSGEKSFRIPAMMSPSISVVNASVSATPATDPAPAITMRNLSVRIVRTA